MPVALAPKDDPALKAYIAEAISGGGDRLVMAEYASKSLLSRIGVVAGDGQGVSVATATSHAHITEGMLQVPAPGSAIVNPLAAGLDHPNPSAALLEAAAKQLAIERATMTQDRALDAGFMTLGEMAKSGRARDLRHPSYAAHMDPEAALRRHGAESQTDPEGSAAEVGLDDAALEFAVSAWRFVAWALVGGFLAVVLLLSWRVLAS
jgi:hypothetical protein